MSIDAAMIQWNVLAASECRFTRAGIFAACASLTGDGGGIGAPAGFGQNFTNSVCPIMKQTPNASARYRRPNCACVRISSPQGFLPHCTKKFMVTPVPLP